MTQSDLANSLWQAVLAGDVAKTEQLLTEDPALVGMDFRPPAEQDPHTDGYPLVQACADGNYELAALLLNYGADVNARSPYEDQREFGMPLHYAVVNGHFDLAHLLLDHGASVDGFTYCDQSMVELLYTATLEAGAPAEMVRRGFQRYLQPQRDEDTNPSADAGEISNERPAAVELFDRVLRLGGQPSISCIVREQQEELIGDLLRTCAERPGTQHDWPQGTIFDNTCKAASWMGYPNILDACRQLCPNLYDAQCARQSIQRAIISHNRDGTYADYRQLIETQLQYLQEIGELEATRSEESFHPLYALAEHFCWPCNYGFRSDISKPEHLVDLAELFLEYGFDDINRRDRDSNMTPLSQAVARGDHPCMKEYVEFLVRQGADLSLDDPDETNPRALVRQIKNADTQAAISDLLGVDA